MQRHQYSDSRRRLKHTAAVCLSAFVLVSAMPAAAQNFPVRPVRMIVPNGPGSPRIWWRACWAASSAKHGDSP